MAARLASRYSVVDLFCGSGGLSLGFERTGRFDTLLGCDIKPEAIDTFLANHHGRGDRLPEGILEDITKAGAKGIRRYLRATGISEPGQLDCLVGGPPCEGFSQNRSINSGGKSVAGVSSRVHKFIDDPRNHLFRWFVEIAAELRPKIVLIENVPTLMQHNGGRTAREILDALWKAGYAVSARVVNAADYGIPQMRRRAFFVGQRRDDLAQTGIKLEFPHRTHNPFPLHSEELDHDRSWLPGDSGYWPSVWEAIGDLPAALRAGERERAPAAYPAAQMSALRRFLRSPSGRPPVDHIHRPLGRNGLARLREMKPGQLASTLTGDLKLNGAYHYSYSRLRWSEPARTITAFAYHIGSGMFGHPEDDRGITMREAARLQTFPDDFEFRATTIRDLSSLIGDSVPPLLALHLGRSICRYLDALMTAKLPASVKHLRVQQTDAVLKRLEGKFWTNVPESDLSHQIDMGFDTRVAGQ